MTEKPKRLAPTRDTLRELYLKSGNRCAFPGCQRILFNNKGVFVGQICHIEAAEPGGERFNKDQTNEQRRESSNLILMCYDHHVETNDVEKFPVTSMNKIKEEHEKLFTDIVGTMLNSVTDYTTQNTPLFAKNLRKINEVLDWSQNDDELFFSIEELNQAVDNFSKIPLQSREFFLVLVNRGEDDYSGIISNSISEIQQATNLQTSELNQYLAVLDKYGVVFDNDTNEFGLRVVGVQRLPSGWALWSDLRNFCKKENIDISLAIINLDFTFLDGAE